ncbi:tyrosine-type recombinase/integrase [Silvanigrella aquatica]|uniref:Integrase n=1 Tax=Silvanigrella aquatica TaxID=1915309 RepID=A0A1L4D080_9BACT|nr:tyrosine-type recombinase/integrase [Silvanigrella aquatica]APJ03612.1 hypothetical protein AXG55_06705 [Silvanigrella aquatica]
MQNDNVISVVIDRTTLLKKEEYIGQDVIEAMHWFIQSYQSENTKQSYTRDLEEFFLFSFKILKVKITTLKLVTERLVIIWKESLSDFSLASVARKLSALSSFLNFSRKRGLIEFNVLELIKKPKLDKRGKTNILNEEEVYKLLEFAKKQYQISRSKQSRCYCIWKLRYTVMHTLFTVGMRAEELCELKINGLENVGQFWRLHLVTKGNLTHSPIIHQQTAQVLLEYKNEFRTDAKPNDYFFIRTQMSKNLTKLNRTSIFDMIKISVRESGVFKDISPHSFRATLATLLHSQGVPILQIQRLLNHKLTTTTSIYIKKSTELSESATQKIDFLNS